jgi:hypothetical protein
MKFLVVMFLLMSNVYADKIIKIEIGKDYKNYSTEELRQRVWRLEKAVWQLQRRVFELEATSQNSEKKDWICKITAMGQTYTGIGGSRAVAEAYAYENCKKGQKGSTFFCKVPKCSN